MKLNRNGTEMIIPLYGQSLGTFFDVQRTYIYVPMRERLPSWISGRIAGSNKLDSLQSDPGLVRGAVESTVLHYLTQE